MRWRAAGRPAVATYKPFELSVISSTPHTSRRRHHDAPDRMAAQHAQTLNRTQRSWDVHLLHSFAFRQELSGKWEAEREAIASVARLKEEMERVTIEAQTAEREADLGHAAELRCGLWRALSRAAPLRAEEKPEQLVPRNTAVAPQPPAVKHRARRRPGADGRARGGPGHPAERRCGIWRLRISSLASGRVDVEVQRRSQSAGATRGPTAMLRCAFRDSGM